MFRASMESLGLSFLICKRQMWYNLQIPLRLNKNGRKIRSTEPDAKQIRSDSRLLFAHLETGLAYVGGSRIARAIMILSQKPKQQQTKEIPKCD